MDEGIQMVVEPPVGDFEELDGLSVEEEYAAEERIKG
jgi:hypothetical protein